MRNFKYALAIAALVAGSAQFAAAQELRDLSVEQGAAAGIVALHPGSLATAIGADRADATYAVGESVHLTLNASQDSYVTVLDVGPSGTVTQLFPNRFQPDNFLRAGQPVEIAGANSGAHIVVGPPTGTELIKVISSNKPIPVIPEGQLKGAGPFRTLEGGAAALQRDLSVVGNAQPSVDTFIAFGNYGLYTIPSRAGAMNPVVVVPAQPVPAAHVEVPAEQPFPLLLATDKTRYRIGEKATIAVTTTQACNLTALDFNAASVARTIYPVAGAPVVMLAAGQTVFVAGGPGPELTVAGPAGAEQILAICTAPDVGAASAGAQLPPAAGGDAVVVVRNLTTVASKPGTAMASAILSVVP